MRHGDGCEVNLVSSMASDLMVVNAARVSFDRRSEELTEADKGLIRFLMRERHGTPFEHNAFTFLIKCPIFVAREWFRHRIGSFNELSARYTEIPDEFWVPVRTQIRTQVGKPGNYAFETVDSALGMAAVEAIESAQRAAYDAYWDLLKQGVAKEVARSVLPVGMMTKFYWTVNARSLMNFLSLRTAQHAQFEIRQCAFLVEDYFDTLMPVTYEAWNEHGRQAP